MFSFKEWFLENEQTKKTSLDFQLSYTIFIYTVQAVAQ